MKFKQIITSIILLILYIVTHYVSPFIGNYYHIKIYPFYDSLLTKIFSWSTIPIGDLLYTVVGLFLIVAIIRKIVKKQYVKSLVLIFNSVLIFLLLFQWSWGINNYKTPLYKALNIENTYTLEELNDYAEKDLLELNNLHYTITSKKDSVLHIEKDTEYFYKEAKMNFDKVWFLKKYNTKVLTPAKESIYSFALTKAGFSGYFNPFTHENQINNEIPTIGMPVTYIHEMAHQLGFASESEANFIAYYTLKQSDNEVLNYAAELYGFKYILKEIRKTNEEKYLLYLSQLNPGIVQNIQDSEDFWKTNKNFSSNIFKPMYGMFLKANNQKQGIRSYNLMVNLMINYDKKYKN